MKCRSHNRSTRCPANIGLTTNCKKEKWGFFAGLLIGIGAFLVTASFQAGNAIGTGIAVSAVTKMNPTIWIIVFTLLAIALLFTKEFYKILEKMKAKHINLTKHIENIWRTKQNRQLENCTL